MQQITNPKDLIIQVTQDLLQKISDEGFN